jgi:hypothetical protein
MTAATEEISSSTEGRSVALPLAAAAPVAENSRQGFATKKSGSHPGWSEVNFKTAAGMEASLRPEGIRSRCQSLNRYAYVMNNPTTLIDPSGLCPNCPPPCANLPYGQGGGMCQSEVNSVIAAEQSLGPGSWDSYDLMGVQVVVNTWVPPTQAGAVFNGVDYPGPVVPGYWNPTQVGNAFFLFAGATQYAQYGPNVPRIGAAPSAPPPDRRPSCISVFWNALEGGDPTDQVASEGGSAVSEAAQQSAEIYIATRALTVPLRSGVVRALAGIEGAASLGAIEIPAALGTYAFAKAFYVSGKANITGQCQNNFWSSLPPVPFP